ncbi:MAG TPA: ATP-binding protein, partial [Acidobacteriota bacterium]|nr:ATP-binding protein [Acidobacteriota bacterium]
GIAHDFNNMLTSMLGNISLARRAKSPVQLETRLTEAERAIGRAQYLTKQLLTFAKGGEPIKSQVNLQALVVETVTFCLRGSSVEPIFRFAPHLPLIDADPGQLGQVIQNLVINARDAMPAGGNLVVSASVITSPQDRSELLRLTFDDEGDGIPANILNRIFDPYYTTKPTGHGLGLAVVYSVVRQHGGTINVTSSQNKGTQFEILLPISPLVEQTPEPLSVPVTPTFENCRILVLDDDDGVREITLEMLYMLGIQATGASRGEQLVELYTQALHSRTPFDLLLLDLTIPGGKGGIWTLNELKKINPQIRAIVCSGYSQDPALAYPVDFGFIGRLVKPFSLEELQAQIRQALTKDG